MKIFMLLAPFLLISCTLIEVIDKTDKQDLEPQKAPEVVQKEVPVEPEIKIINTKTFENSEKVIDYCSKMDFYFKKYDWGNSHCNDYSWNHVRNSYLGNPIIWHVFGDEKLLETKKVNTTMILCGVHGDEITPIKFCFDILEDLKNNPKVLEGNLVVVAPLVTPDSFMREKPTRYNARGVDVNRNFPTQDWNKSAIKLWKSRYKSDKRRYPGAKALSEQETHFQVNLIKRYKPNKIITVHSPLTLIDYDGPSAHEHEGGILAEELLIQMSDKAGKYRINNYPFFTGSLGNWAGNERKIPTYTLELPNSDWTKTKKFFNTFKTAIHHAITHPLSKDMNKKMLTDNEEPVKKDDNVL